MLIQSRFAHVTASGCPRGFVSVPLPSRNNYCYYLEAMNLQWQSAGLYCRALDSRAHLIVVNSQEEQQLIAQGLQRLSSKYTNTNRQRFLEEKKSSRTSVRYYSTSYVIHDTTNNNMQSSVARVEQRSTHNTVQLVIFHSNYTGSLFSAEYPSR